MESFSWADCFDTGLPSVDDQHRGLVDLINHFGQLVVRPQGASGEDLQAVHERLLRYAAEHFSDEEALMASAGVDARHREAHHAEHDRFLHDVVRLHAQADADRESARGLLRFMIHWLAYHILGFDQAMARQMAAVARGVRPASAWEETRPLRDPATATLLQALDALFQQVSERNRELSELNHHLELRIAERTRELREANGLLEDLALTDVLTGLINRRGALRRLHECWAEAGWPPRPLACIMLDADGFKAVNDAHGHAAGDEVLKQLAWQVQTSVRTDDAVCRLGGDEFIVVCPQTPLAGALQLAEKIRRDVARLQVPVGDGVWHGSTSLGVGVRTSGMASVEELLEAADQGLYRAKRQGGDAVGCVQEGAGSAPPP